mmetsp:Transcript_8667/g.18422  ORF Transcript_8667/g.18422 Transcript_8667/m.18422 type:complete len:81 (-) Transcript_8667:253-495(-)
MVLEVVAELALEAGEVVTYEAADEHGQPVADLQHAAKIALDGACAYFTHEELCEPEVFSFEQTACSTGVMQLPLPQNSRF